MQFCSGLATHHSDQPDGYIQERYSALCRIQALVLDFRTANIECCLYRYLNQYHRGMQGVSHLQAAWSRAFRQAELGL